jgi:hypothetical protein
MKTLTKRSKRPGKPDLNVFPIVFILSILFSLISCTQRSGSPIIEDVSGEYYDWTKTMQPEQPWIRDYNKTMMSKIFLCSRNEKGNVEKVYLKFEDVLEVLRKLDNITLGIPKIAYLVGWQYNGHDSKYPAWDEVNVSLKRDADSTALESLKWLIKEAKRYNTTISLHINMIDAFEDSPLWSEYLAKDIIAKDSLGIPIKGEVFNGVQSYQISYAREWNLGYTQKRIDKLIKMLPELKEGGTIHLDAFHSMRPSGPGKPISPYLGLSIEDEMNAQRKIIRYWRKQGIDVTCEGAMYWLRKDPFIGLQASTWWFDEKNFVREEWLNKPKNFSALPPELSCYSSMHCEGEIQKDPEKLSGLLEQFCLKLVPWYYKRNIDVSLESYVIITRDKVICPVLWKDRALVAYSKLADIDEKVELPSTWVDAMQVQIYELTLEGLTPKETLKVTDGIIDLKIVKNQPTVIMPVESE